MGGYAALFSGTVFLSIFNKWAQLKHSPLKFQETESDKNLLGYRTLQVIIVSLKQLHTWSGFYLLVTVLLCARSNIDIPKIIRSQSKQC